MVAVAASSSDSMDTVESVETTPPNAPFLSATGRKSLQQRIRNTAARKSTLAYMLKLKQEKEKEQQKDVVNLTGKRVSDPAGRQEGYQPV